MLTITVPLGDNTLSGEVLSKDKKNCLRSGPCGLGDEALYIGSRFISRLYYIRWDEVRRVYKRIAMSPGGFSGSGAFGTMAYLVVQCANGKEKTCYFKIEKELDSLLSEIERQHPDIPTHSAQAEQRLAAAAREEVAKYKSKLSKTAEETWERLNGAVEHLELRPDIYRNLTAAAKQKRIVDNLSPSVLVGGTAVFLAGLCAVAYGLYGLSAHTPNAVYFLLGGVAAAFAVFSANLVPGRWGSKANAQKDWESAVRESAEYVSGFRYFPVPAQYAHPVVLKWMIRAVRESRAETAQEALETVKTDLRNMNSSVSVTQEIHDDVVDIKPLFLVCDYAD